MRRPFLVIGSLLLLAAIAAGIWLTQRRPVIVPEPPTTRSTLPAPSGVPALPAELAGPGPVLAWTAHAQARFEPCGCVAGMFGGLLRRAGLLARIDADRLVACELGGWSGGAEAHERLRTDHYLRALADSGIDAVGLGRPEVALGAEVLAVQLSRAKAAGLPVVCANLDGIAVEPLRRLDAGGRRLIITSIIPADASGAGLTIRDPADALAGLLARTDGAELVVLADLDEQALAALAHAVPGIRVLVGGAVAAPSERPILVGATRIVHVGNHGKVAGWWAWDAERCRFDLLAETLPEAPAIRAHLVAYQQALAGASLSIDRAAPAGDGKGYAGDAACTACHGAAASVHAASRHHHSIASVQRRGYGHDPDCLRCHVTGLGRPGGFTRTAPEDSSLRRVSCEACHGPAEAHVAAGGHAPTVPVSEATCRTCHDAENSPRFDYASYWSKIVHGR